MNESRELGATNVVEELTKQIQENKKQLAKKKEELEKLKKQRGWKEKETEQSSFMESVD